MGCGRPLPKRTGATPGPSTLASGGTGHLFQGRFGAVVMAHPRGIEYSISLLFLVGSHHCLR
jgi:hypothetical protein